MTASKVLNPPWDKASKGTVQVITSNDRLQLRFRFGSKRHYLSIGLPDTRTNRIVAEQRAKQIELDIISGNFDETLDKYRSPSARKVFEEKAIKTPPEVPTLPALWERYCDVRQPVVAPGTWRNGYKVNTSHLNRCPYKKLDEAQQIFDWATASLRPDPAKRFVQALGACCKWAVRSHLISHNPFDGMAGEVKLTKKNDEDADIDPFSRQERQAIINAFETNRYYRHYTNLVKFLFYTGCRPSEAIALQWKHISETQILFEQVIVQSESGLVLVEGLKSQSRRKFPVNTQLSQLLNEMKGDEVRFDEFLFSGPKGKYVDFHNFRNRGWQKVLTKLGIRYRKPYQTRHTFITHCLEEGVSIPQVAKWVGNTPEVIMKHYAGILAQIQVPEV